MFEALRKLYQRRRQPVPGLTQQFLDLPPHGDILVLGLPHEEVSPATDSIGDRLVTVSYTHLTLPTILRV